MTALVIVLVRSTAAATVVQLVLSMVILYIWFVCAHVWLYSNRSHSVAHSSATNCPAVCNPVLWPHSRRAVQPYGEEREMLLQHVVSDRVTQLVMRAGQRSMSSSVRCASRRRSAFLPTLLQACTFVQSMHCATLTSVHTLRSLYPHIRSRCW